MGASNPQADPLDSETIVNSIAKRISRIPPSLDKGLKDKLKCFVNEFMRKHFVPLHPDEVYDFNRWIEETNYSEARRNELRKCHLELEQGIVQWGSKQVNKVSCFVKDETYPEYKNARGIYARSDWFKTRFGPICKSIENKLYHHSSFIKHVPVEERARYVYNKLGNRSSYMATDYTGFECHFTREMMELIEFQFYRYMYSMSSKLDEVEKCLKVISGLNNCKFKNVGVIIPARRMSGEMNTSLGNGFSNFVMYHFVHHLLGNEEVDCVIEGDDCLGCFRGTYPTTELYEKLGFTVKIEQHSRLETASFCGLVFDTDSFVSIADPIKHILNVSWCSAKFSNCSDKTRRELLRGKGFSLVNQYAGVPILQSLGKCILRLTKGERYRLDLSNYQLKQFVARETEKTVNYSSRILMEQVFKIPVAMQLALESYFDAKSSLEDYFHPLIYDCCKPDQIDYYNTYVRYTQDDTMAIFSRSVHRGSNKI